MTTITNRKLNSACPKSAPYFIRDNRVIGFAVKVNPSGTVKFIAEVWHEGKSIRKTLGNHPIMSVAETRRTAVSFINEVRQGKRKGQKKQQTLVELFDKHIDNNRLKPNTIKNYRHVVFFYLSDWLHQPISWITKEKVESQFYQIRDKGMIGGRPRGESGMIKGLPQTVDDRMRIAEELVNGLRTTSRLKKYSWTRWCSRYR